MSFVKDFIKKAFPSFASSIAELRRENYAIVKGMFWHLPLPSIVPIQLTNLCNARCIFCQYPKNVDKKGCMSLSTFKTIIDELVDCRIQKIHLIGTAGEVYLDKEIIDKIAYAKKNNIYIYITTNGTLFHIEDYARRTLDLGVERIFISTPGFSSEAYERVFGVKNYSKFFPGIINLLEYKEKCGIKTDICFGFRADRPIAEVENDPDYLYSIKKFVDRGILRAEDHRTSFDTWAGEVAEENFIGSMEVLTKTSDVFCPKLYTPQIGILYDGSVKLCGCSYHKTEFDDMVIGHINSGLLHCLGSIAVKKIFFNYFFLKKLPYICQTCTRPEERKK
ncbi:radical SAM protein [uncultured Desulfovibrio sp.]|uniref:radical SAM protein n=1 Tax=uncultured Desulfovibrio sp. TaxID=167968 RepID=UPI00272D07A8|nr:radical SAM protein [uncultured Desulfovibrio sp.]